MILILLLPLLISTNIVTIIICQFMASHLIKSLLHDNVISEIFLLAIVYFVEMLFVWLFDRWKTR